MFLFKKSVAPLFLPLPFCLLLLFAGLFLLWLTRRQRTGKLLVTLGTVSLALLGHPFVAETILRPLETAYPPLLLDGGARTRSVQDAINPIQWVVVLGGGHATDPALPVTSRIAPDSLVRLVEGIRLYRKLPGSRLLLSGGSGPDDPLTVAEAMAQTAEILGISRSEMILETASRDTKDQARLIRPIIGTDRFVLVTTASHLPRAVALFQKQGLTPLPAPTEHKIAPRRSIHPGWFYPSAESLRNTRRAIYEYLGMRWAKWRGQMQGPGPRAEG